MMPIVGFLTSKIDVRKLLAVGFFVAGLFTFDLARLAEPERGATGTSSGRRRCRAPAWP